MNDFKTLFKRLEKCCQKNSQNHSVYEIIVSIQEELGKAVRVENGDKKSKVDEHSKIEAIDVILTTFEVFLSRGGTYKDFFEIANQKLTKFEESL
jgi:hypothetical protein